MGSPPGPGPGSISGCRTEIISEELSAHNVSKSNCKRSREQLWAEQPASLHPRNIWRRQLCRRAKPVWGDEEGCRTPWRAARNWHWFQVPAVPPPLQDPPGGAPGCPKARWSPFQRGWGVVRHCPTADTAPLLALPPVSPQPGDASRVAAACTGASGRQLLISVTCPRATQTPEMYPARAMQMGWGHHPKRLSHSKSPRRGGR